MNAVLRVAGQAPAYAAFAALIAWFSVSPAYSPIAPGQALLKLSFSHYGQRLGECRQRSAEELARLPPNMRAALDCPRERAPIRVELELDGAPLYSATLQPTGLSRDGSAYVYQRFPIPAGRHRIVARLSDDPRRAGFGYVHEQTLVLAPAELAVIDFDPQQGGFVLHGASAPHAEVSQ